MFAMKKLKLVFAVVVLHIVLPPSSGVNIQRSKPLRQQVANLAQLHNLEAKRGWHGRSAENEPYRKNADEEEPLIFIRSKKRLRSPRFLVRYPNVLRNGGNDGDADASPSLDDQMHQVFDKNGMYYLTPQQDEDNDRQLNTLMNKVVKYNVDKKLLRKHVKPNTFNSQDMMQLQQILKYLKQKPSSKPKIVFDFNDLVAR